MTTWDGQPIAAEAPSGAAVVVYRRGRDGLEFLMLHRAHDGPDHEGDWAWGAPSGARHPGEPIEDCARRELTEETGLTLDCRPIVIEGQDDWPHFLAEVSGDVTVVLSPEHDRYEWMSLQDAIRCCLPERVANSLSRAAELIV